MDGISITTAILDQADEEILITAFSDEALEAAACPERGAFGPTKYGTMPNNCC